MIHTRFITRKPAAAQSAYASKLQFKQDASAAIADNNLLRASNIASLLGLLFSFVVDTTTTTS